MASTSNREKRKRHIIGSDDEDDGNDNSIEVDDDTHASAVEPKQLGQQSCEGEDGEGKTKKVRKNTSDVWKYFTRIGIVDGKEKAKCNACGQKYSVILSLAIILDPRMKLEGIKYTFTNIDPLNSKEKIENIRSKLYDVFNEYKCAGSSSSSSQVVESASASNSTQNNVLSSGPSSIDHLSSNCFLDEDMNDNDVFGDLLTQCSNERAIAKSELDYYLEEGTLDSRVSTKFDVLDFWKANTGRFPCLSKMACDILSIPITTVASESAFSIGSRVLTKYRSSILPENVEALICAQNWLLGFPWNEDVEAEKKETAPVPIFPASENASNTVD